jgi:hypothetical protein
MRRRVVICRRSVRANPPAAPPPGAGEIRDPDYRAFEGVFFLDQPKTLMPDNTRKLSEILLAIRIVFG